MTDWRLTAQEEYLSGATLTWAVYTPYSATWDHDHCEFCWKKFAVHGGDLTAGYTTDDRYRWVCETCCKDFQETFKWTVVGSPTESPP